MKRATIVRRVMPILFSGAAALPVGGSFAAAAKAQAYSGATECGQHGPVRVTIKVKNHKIVSVAAATSPADGRSVFLQSQAIPYLKRETLSAQSYNINYVSGATETSEAYIMSLRSAISRAKSHKALK